MSTVQQILDDEDARWHELTALLGKLSEEDWLRSGAAGDWSARDVLAHIAAWHAEAVDEMEQLRETGHVKRTWTDVQAFNADAHERCAHLNLHDVRVTSGASRHRFREEIASAGAAMNEKMATFVTGCAAEHYNEHIGMLEAFLGARP